MQVRKMEVQTASNMHSWIMQVWKTEVGICEGWKCNYGKHKYWSAGGKHKYENVRFHLHVWY